MFHTEALRLEELLAGHGVAARVGQATVSTEGVRFPLQLGLGTTARRVFALTHDLARETGYSRCRVRRDGRRLFLELPRDEGAGLRYGDLLQRTGQPPPGSALLGMTASGASLALPLATAAASHLLVSGGAGAGKSELLRVVALGMASHHAPRHLRLALLDGHPHRSALASLRELPHCWAWSDRPEHAVGWLVRLLNEMVEREQGHATGPRVLALVDDAERLAAAGGTVLVRVLGALLERGAAVGIHLAVACRAAENLGPLAARFPTRLAAEGPALPGHFHLLHEESAAPVLAARLDEPEVADVVRWLRASRPRVVARPAEGRLP